MASVHDYITPDAAKIIRNAIADAQGHEVLCLGHTNAERMIDTVEVLARGNEVTVAAVTQLAKYGDVVIHNHPTGSLTPSDADVNVAAQAALEGVAAFIVNNDVSEVYVVIEPMQPPHVQPLDGEALLALLAQDGAMAHALKKYEERPAQRDMLREVVAAFNHDKISVIEAGTGTGKTLAYLIPAIAWALQNNERVVISTHTINLQEQIMHKDLPLVRKIMPQEFKAVLVKGRKNYVCLRKVHMIEDEPELFEDEDSSELHHLIEWAMVTKTGDLADLGMFPKARVWEKIQSSNETCFKAHCPFFKDCFVSRARRDAATAQVLVTNHALLFVDVVVRGFGGAMAEASILPKYTRIVFDEAHNIEEVATDQFGADASRRGYLRAMSLLYRRGRARETGSLAVLRANLLRAGATVRDTGLTDPLLEALDMLISTQLPALNFAVTDCFEALSRELASATKNEEGTVQYRITPERRTTEMWPRCVAQMQTLRQATRAFVSAAGAITRPAAKLPLEDEKLASALLDVTSHVERLNASAETLDAVCGEDNPEFVTWLESRVDNTYLHVSVNRAPLNIAEAMITKVYECFPTIVMTSATLTSRQRFEFLENRIGLTAYKQRLAGSPTAAGKARPISTLLLPTPFHYRTQTLVAIPTDLDAAHLRAPREAAGEGHALGDAIVRLLRITHGSAFVLFTSYGLLRKLAKELRTELEAAGMTLFVQGTEHRDELLKRFRKASHAVLFGTDSFWAGVDVVGEALQSVIITKLPFRVPTEPIIEARTEYIDQHGGNSFLDYTVPLAVIKFRQGFGRLIRSKSDYGMVAILDRRVLEKYYGRWFLESLPECAHVDGPLEKVEATAQAFFTQHRAGKKRAMKREV
jgi:ATP-dependent DNA helicase DinG